MKKILFPLSILSFTIIALITMIINSGCSSKPTPVQTSTATAGNNGPAASLLPSLIKNPVDGAEMILVPAGTFKYRYVSDSENNTGKNNENKGNSSKTEDEDTDDQDNSGDDKVKTDTEDKGQNPGSDKSAVVSRDVYVGDFYIYKYEVTNAQFAKFCKVTGYKSEGNWERWTNEKTMDYPVVMVSWNDAQAYCKWAGVKLPAEAEWLKAASGSKDGLFPWGDDKNPAFCNNGQTPHDKLKDKVLTLMGKTGTMPVGSFPEDISPFGIFDMAGNVQEWCSDWYSDNYLTSMPDRNPSGPDSGEDRVIRGGSYFHPLSGCTIIERHDNFPRGNDTYIGFRCAWTTDMPMPSPVSETSSPARTESSPSPSAAAVEKPSPAETVSRSNLPATSINKKDGAELILIPHGSFTMGASDSDKDAGWEEKPPHKVMLSAYYIYKYEVTFDQFNRFVNETGYKTEGSWKKHFSKKNADHPVVYVTWKDAEAYCKWAGGKLPTEARWEKAARGSDGRVFPWGNIWNPDFCNNFELKDKKLLSERHIYYDGMGTTRPGLFKKDISPYGVSDMGGNVIEWCYDWYDPSYYKSSPGENPSGPPSGTQKVMRGGGWGQPRQVCRSGYRDKERPHDTDGDFGFRCVIEIEGIIKKSSN
ncbi:MAG: SUMF1/EgtB/PvdO family nonheme iron enzyme [Firmicutes bacterium]|nr:SUMF1/EgtB/PvdO family nonheme iron enzyme [Bacillota bacterium]